MLPFLAPLGSLVVGLFRGNAKILMIIGAVVVAGILIWQYNKSIRQAAFDVIYREQAEQIIKDNNALLEKQKKLLDDRDKQIREIINRRREQRETYDRIQDDVRNDVEEDAPVAPIIRFTIEELRNLENKRNGEFDLESKEEKEESTGNSVIDQFLKEKNKK